MANEVTYGKDRYHQHREMEMWCKKNIGEGRWTHGEPSRWDDNTWVMWSMFGNTTFCFKNPEDLINFKNTWDNKGIQHD